jgi:phosphoribosylaminoimidazole (AIR) synthetase
MNNSQTVFEYLGHELIVRCANDLICARALYVQCCSLPTSSFGRSIQRFYQGIEQACQQLDCTFLKTTSITSSSSFNALCTGVCNREFLILNNNNNNSIINDGDLLIGLRCSSGTINSQGYIQLKELFQKKNIHLNDTLPFRSNDGEEESFFSLLLQKSSILTPALATIINELVLNRTIKVIRYLKGRYIYMINGLFNSLLI